MEKLPIEISLAHCSDDFAFAYSCARDLALMENLMHLPSISEAQFIKDGLSSNPPFELIIAKQNGIYAASALFHYGYSSWKGKSLYLCDLVVKEAFRSKGIGRELMKRLIDIANENQVKIVWWYVSKTNQPAINLYKSFSASFDDKVMICKLDEKILNQYQA